jgi:GH35 family endo-1,4-beta-xylanase
MQRALLLLGLMVLVACETAVSPPTPSPPSALMGNDPVVQQFASPAYGIQAFMWWKADIAQRDLALIQAMGFGWVKQEFSWREIEGIKKGERDWYRPDLIVDMVEDAGLNLVVRLDRQPFWTEADPLDLHDNAPPANLQDFGDFCGALAERYHGRIAAYQVWNEPNLSREWGNQPPDPVQYTQLLKVCYEAIKAADPDAIVISAGLSPTGTNDATAVPDADFLQGMYDAGAAAYFDVLGLHAPGYNAPPELDPAEAEANKDEYGGGRWFAFRHVEDMRAIMVASGDGAKQVAILEMGWTLDTVHSHYSWFAVDEQTQADYLVRAYQYAAENWRPWIGLMSTIYIADYHWTQENEQWWWAIVLPDGTPRPAYEALREMEKE